SHYEDVLVVRVHKLVPEPVWSKRYDQINDFETMLTQNDTTILKFFLHISPRNNSRVSSNGSTIRRDIGRSVKATTPSASYGQNTLTLTKKRSQKQAQSTRPGTLFQQTISGSEIWRCRRSLPILWMRWA